MWQAILLGYQPEKGHLRSGVGHYYPFIWFTVILAKIKIGQKPELRVLCTGLSWTERDCSTITLKVIVITTRAARAGGWVWALSQQNVWSPLCLTVTLLCPMLYGWRIVRVLSSEFTLYPWKGTRATMILSTSLCFRLLKLCKQY